MRYADAASHASPHYITSIVCKATTSLKPQILDKQIQSLEQRAGTFPHQATAKPDHDRAFLCTSTVTASNAALEMPTLYCMVT
jgi:hypothetical protein